VPVPSKKYSVNLLGILFMIINGALMTGVAVMVRQVAEDLHPFQIAFFRNFFGVIILLPLLLRYGLEPLKTNDMRFMVTRGIFNAAAMLSYFMALPMLPLAEISALSFTAPLFVALLATIFLKERMGPRRIVSLIVGFSGVLIILRPGVDIIQISAFYAIFSAIS
jgi:drug/metabolite transporter (DMT)-like permease